MKDKTHNMYQDQRGVAALLAVVVILAFALALGLAVAKFSVNELSLGLDADRTLQALETAESCADETQFRLKLDSGYTGATIPIGNGSCTSVVVGGGSTRTLTITSAEGDLDRDVVVSTTLTTNVATNVEGADITNWEEN